MRYYPASIPLLVLAAARLPAQAGDAAALAPDTRIEGQLAGGQSHEYQFGLHANEFARIWINQTSIDVAMVLLDPTGNQVYAGDVARIGDPEQIETIAEATGTYRLRVTASDATAPAGRYDITLTDITAATEQHRHRIAAIAAVTEGRAAFRQESSEAMRSSIRSYEKALGEWRAAQDVVQEARVLYNIGSNYTLLGERQKAMDFTMQALQVARAARDPGAEAWALDCLGDVYEHFGDKKKAVEYHNQALPLRRAEGQPPGGLGNTLNALGIAHARLGEKRQALEYFVQASEIFRRIQDRRSVATIASNMGVAYGDLGEFRLELDSYNEALRVQREMGTLGNSAITLSNIGLAYLHLGEYQKALESLSPQLISTGTALGTGR